MNPNTRPIKVCFVAPKAYPLFDLSVKRSFGGAEVDLYLLAKELAKDRNFAVSFITADYGQQKTKRIENVRIIRSLNFKENPLSGAIKVWQAMRVADAQIYFQEAASWGTFLVSLFCKSHKKMFVYRTAHQRECDGTYLKQHYFAGKAFRWSLHTATQPVVQNEIDRKTLKETTGVHSIIIPNAHHLPVLPVKERNAILWVGRSTRIKRPELFIDLTEQMPNEQFTIICQPATGDKNYEQLVTRAKQVKNLEFIERVPFHEIDDYFQRAKLFVCTSKGEGFPNTYVQACKNATPILSLCVNPDNFLNRYECGVCADDNWDRFVQQFRMLLNPEKAQQYGNNARKYAEQKHDIKNIIKTYKGLFLKLE